jgi:hypothetical protein
MLVSDVHLQDSTRRIAPVSGNPMRTITNWLPLRLEKEWQTQLATAQFAKVTAITWPLLCLYVHPMVPAGRSAAATTVDGSPAA